MDEAMKEKLRGIGREDLIEVHEISVSGYAGVLSNGNIVDRRKHPEAIIMKENKMLNIPKPKDLPEGFNPLDHKQTK